MTSTARPSHRAGGDLSAVRFGAWLLAFGALGLYERLCVPGPPATLAPTDAYYYGRLAWLSRLSFPRPVTFDAWVAFPGMEVPWPPGHAWLLAALQGLFGAEAPFSPQGQAALAWAGPVLSLLGIGLLVAWAARRFGRWTAIAVAGALLVQPFAADVGQLGEADHHLHEVFFAAALALAFARAARPGARPILAAATLGVVAGLPYFFTLSGFLYLPPLAAASLLAHLARARGRWRRAVAVAVGSAVALALVFLGALSTGRLGRGDYVRLSGFHLALGSAVLAAACLPLLRGPTARLRRLGLGLGGLAATGLAFTAAPSLRELARAVAHLGRGSAVLSEAAESTPLFAGAIGAGLAATLMVAVPLLLGAGLLLLRSRRAPGWLLPLLGFFAFLALVTLAQARFARPLLGLSAVLAGLLVQRVASAARPLGWPCRVTARLAAVALLVPPPVALAPYSDEDSRFIEGLAPGLEYLRRSLPPAGDPWNPSKAPAWGVLADWNLGHLVVALGERPALASPFGQAAEAEEAAAGSRRLLESADPVAAALECRRRGLRYALIYEPPPQKEARTLRQRLAAGQEVPGFRALWAGTAAHGGRIPRVFEIAPPGSPPAAAPP